MSEHTHPKAVQSQRFTNLAESFGGARIAKPTGGEILILCPRTNTPVTSGLRIGWVVFKSLSRVAVPLRYPACGLTHRWKPDEAWIGTNA
jgi:hypothetical protein